MSFNATDISNGVSISGSTNPYNTYIKTENAGVYDIQFSAQVEKTDSGTDEIIIWLRKNGVDLIDTATTMTLVGNSTKVVAAWNWFVTSAANDYYQIIWISADTGMRLLAETISATHPGIPSVILTVNRIDTFLSNTGSFSGSFIGTHTGSFTGSFTGSLLGTASWADSASQALTASYYNETDPIFVAKSASLATTGSNTFIGNQVVSGSFIIETASSAAALRITQLGAGEAIRVEDNTTPDSTAFIVDSSGSVGIGLFTSSLTLAVPLYPLHVIAPSGVDARMVFDGKQLGNGAANANITIAADTNDKVASFDFLDRNGVAYNGTATYTGPTVKFLLDRSGSSAPLATGGRRNDFYIVNGFADRAIIFHTSASDGNLSANVPGRPRLTITGSNVGIGTTDPRYKLHVRNGAVTDSSTWGGSVGVFENSGSNAYLSVLASNTYAAGIGFGTAAHRVSANLYWNSTTKGFDLATNTASAFLTFGTDTGTERMRITSGGLVGIGTTTPQHMLDVSGSTRITSSLYLPGLTSSPEVNVVLINTSSGQLYYTASSAIGGGGGGPSQPVFPYTGSAIITGSLVITGSTTSTLGFTGSLFGTASWADSASQALTASYVLSSSYASVNLQQVTDQGNITTNNILIGSNDSVGIPYLGFWDEDELNYGRLYFLNNEFRITDYAENPFVSFGPGTITIPGGLDPLATSTIDSPYNSTSRVVNLPDQDGILVLSVNGTTADTSGSITLTTVPTASYINALNQNVVITGSISSLNTTASQETFSSTTYVSGDIIQGTVVGVSQYDLAYLNIDGTWQHVDQTSDTSTKMLGIYLGGDQILIDGNISAITAGVGSPIGVDIMNPNQGLPVYIDSGSAWDFNTTIPTSNYIRTLGYVYYNNTSNANNWILKFRPSTDWYKI